LALHRVCRRAARARWRGRFGAFFSAAIFAGTHFHFELSWYFERQAAPQRRLLIGW